MQEEIPFGKRIGKTPLHFSPSSGILISWSPNAGTGDTMEAHDHQNALLALLDDIRKKTGVEIYFQPRGGEETCFSLRAEGRTVEAYVAGTGEQAEKSAKLAAYLVSVCAREPYADRREELREVLLGEGGNWRVFRYMNKYNVPDGACFAVEVVPDRLAEETLAQISMLIEEERIAIVKFVEEDQTAFEFGTFLAQSLYEELGVRASVGVGCEVKSFREIASSYAQAAAAVRMSNLFHGEGEVHSYREYLLVRLLEDVPRSRLMDYMEQFHVEGAGEVFEDEEMTATAEEFLESSLNISETSRNLFMHRNTLTYRLDKIERATGLNIRKFSDAVTFRVLSILYKLLDRA